jgi:inosose dehydratase
MLQIANAPCSWGVIEGVEGERGGYQRVLDEMHETGYAGTELGEWGFLPTEPAALREALAQRDLALVGS